MHILHIVDLAQICSHIKPVENHWLFFFFWHICTNSQDVIAGQTLSFS